MPTSPITKAILIAVISAIGLFAVLTLGFGNGGIHGTSICEWNRILPDRSESYQGRQIGSSLPIRSDEWAVSLPFVLAQCESEKFFPPINDCVNGGTDMMIQTPCAPVWDWTVPGQFHNWGYFLFGARHGIAWAWWSRYLLLPLFAFLFLLKWCDNDAVLAIAGAAAITLGAPTQWWDTTVPYHLVYFFGTLVFTRLVMSAKNSWLCLASGAGLVVMLASFFFVNYLPFSMLLLPPLAILAAYEVRNGLLSRKGRNPRIWIVVAALCATASLFVYFLCAHHDTLNIIRNSSYPGKRFCNGGSINFLCERTLLDWVSFCTAFAPQIPRFNQCQAAEYIGLAIPCLSTLIYLLAKKSRCWTPDLLMGYATVLYAWAMFAWPDFLAKWSGLSAIPPQRATVIAGFVVLICALKLAGLKDENKPPLWLALSTIVCYIGVRIFAFCNAPDLWDYFWSSGKMLLFFEGSALLTSLAAWGLLRRQKPLFSSALILFSITTGCFVHPICEGVSAMYDKALSEKIKGIDHSAPGIWTSNNRCIAQLPVALGLRAYSGTQTYCDERFWRIVDPAGSHKPVWNRYGHRNIFDFDGRCVPDNRKIGDCIFFSLNEEKTRSLDIRYIIWRGNQLHLPWLRHLASIRDNHIYEVKSENKENE